MTCPACLTRTTRDTHTLCDQCAWQVRRDLDDLPALAKEINTTLTKQARFDNGKSRPGKNRPLDLARDEDVDRFLRSWETRTQLIRLRDSIPRTIRKWMEATNSRRHELAHRISLHEKAAEAYAEITGLAASIRKAIDRPPDLVFAGKCGTIVETDGEPGDGTARGGVGHWRCDKSLYAEPGRPTVRCTRCGATHDVADRRAQLLTELDNQLCTAAEIAKLVVHLGDLGVSRQQTRKLINKWNQRGRLPSYGTHPPRFRFGDVLALLARHRAKDKAAA